MQASPSRRKSLVVAHLSDIHLDTQGPSAERLAAALNAVQDHPAKPAMILGGGDFIMDGLAAPVARAQAQWDLWRAVYKDSTSLPLAPCLGNHDVFGWDCAASGADPQMPGYGKAMALEALEMGRPYYSFDRRGWHFIVLDSIHPWGRRGAGLAQAMLDQAQFEWLVGDLASTHPSVPILILSHHPIRSGRKIHFKIPRTRHGESWIHPNAWLHMDADLIEPLFALHGKVRLCLAGHLHRRDRCESAGVVHFGSGAVCGDLWRAPHPECPPSASIVTLYDDGAFDCEWIDLP